MAFMPNLLRASHLPTGCLHIDSYGSNTFRRKPQTANSSIQGWCILSQQHDHPPQPCHASSVLQAIETYVMHLLYCISSFVMHLLCCRQWRHTQPSSKSTQTLLSQSMPASGVLSCCIRWDAVLDDHCPPLLSLQWFSITALGDRIEIQKQETFMDCLNRGPVHSGGVKVGWRSCRIRIHPYHGRFTYRSHCTPPIVWTSQRQRETSHTA